MPAAPGHGQVRTSRQSQRAQCKTCRLLEAPQPTPQDWASRGMPELVVRGHPRQPARRRAGTPTPRRPRAARIARSQRFKGVLSASRRHPGRRPHRPPQRSRSRSGLLHVLELTDFVGQFVRHADGNSVRSDGHRRKGPGHVQGTGTGRATTGRDQRLAPAPLNISPLFAYS